jgi:TRAP-type uncharacterized transport system fused permease subunit
MSVALPIAMLLATSDFDAQSSTYALSVVGATAISSGATAFYASHLRWVERVTLFVTFAIFMAIGLTIAYTKPTSLFFTVLAVGIGLLVGSRRTKF